MPPCLGSVTRTSARVLFANANYHLPLVRAAARVRASRNGPEDSAPTTYARAQVATSVGTVVLDTRRLARWFSEVHSEHASLLIGTC